MIIGHQKQISFLKRSIERNAVFHAYFFHGPSSVGKFAVALDFARKIAGNKFNIHVVSPETTEKKGIKKTHSIKVERIREIIRSVSLTSPGEGYQVVIIDNAGHLSVSAQNALLKTLEEPSGKSVFILIDENKNALLPTIRSRCFNISFQIVAEKEMRAACEGNLCQEEFIFWAAGRPGLLKNIIESKEELEKRKEAQEELKSVLSGDVFEKFILAESLSKSPAEVIEKLSFWTLLLRRDMIGQKMLSGVSSAKAFGMIEGIERNLELLRATNANTRLVLENLLLGF